MFDPEYISWMNQYLIKLGFVKIKIDPPVKVGTNLVMTERWVKIGYS